MSVTFATSSGSVENLNVSLRQGYTSYARKIRATVPYPIPKCVARRHELHCVTTYFFGGVVDPCHGRFGSGDLCLSVRARVLLHEARCLDLRLLVN